MPLSWGDGSPARLVLALLNCQLSWAGAAAGELAGRRVSSRGMAAGCAQTSRVERGRWEEGASLPEV